MCRSTRVGIHRKTSLSKSGKEASIKEKMNTIDHISMWFLYEKHHKANKKILATCDK